MLLGLGELNLDLILSSHELHHSIILGESEAGTLLHNLVEVRNFGLEFRDDFAGFLFLVLGGLDESPGFLDFFLEDANGAGVFLGELDSGLDTGRVLHDRVLKLFAALDETLFTFI